MEKDCAPTVIIDTSDVMDDDFDAKSFEFPVEDVSHLNLDAPPRMPQMTCLHKACNRKVSGSFSCNQHMTDVNSYELMNKKRKQCEAEIQALNDKVKQLKSELSAAEEKLRNVQHIRRKATMKELDLIDKAGIEFLLLSVGKDREAEMIMRT